MGLSKKSKCGKCCNQTEIPVQEYPSCDNLKSVLDESCCGVKLPLNIARPDSNIAAALSGITTVLLAVQSNMLTFNSTMVRLADQMNNRTMGKTEDDQKRRIDELETQNKELQKQLAAQETRLSRVEKNLWRLDREECYETSEYDDDKSENVEISEDIQLDIHNLYTWKDPSSFITLPSDAVLGSHDINGIPIYVGRSKYEDSSIPAKIIPGKKTAYITYAGREIPQDQYEILCGTGFSWDSSSNGQVPPHAVSTGCTLSGEELYIGRGKFAGLVIPGKVHPSHNCLYLGYEGAEVSLTSYDVLVYSASWVKSHIHDSVPDQAVVAGYDNDGAKIYVGKSAHSGDMLPAKVIPQRNVCYVSFDGEEISKDSYGILTGTGFTWVKSDSGRVPPNAVIGGITSYGERLYVGRAHHNGSLTLGKVHPSHQCLFLPYGCLEHRHKEYEVLVKSPVKL